MDYGFFYEAADRNTGSLVGPNLTPFLTRIRTLIHEEMGLPSRTLFSVSCADLYYDLGWQARERYPQLSCCSDNGPRGLGCLSEWAVMRASDAIVINYYGPSTATLAAPNGTQVTLVQQTAYPVDGAIRITVTPSQAAAFAIRLRIPEWSVSNRLDVNCNVQPCATGSYAELAASGSREMSSRSRWT